MKMMLVMKIERKKLEGEERSKEKRGKKKKKWIQGRTT